MLIRALVLLLATLIVLLPTWLRSDWDGTEGRRVQIALEMLRGDNWMIPMLGGEPTWAKPPLHYWLLMLCTKCFGLNYMALRLPAVLAAFASALVAGELLRSRFGAATGWLGAFGMICSPMVVFLWPTAEIDPLFASLTGLSIWLLSTGVASERRFHLAIGGLVAGLAFLQKGPPYFLFAIGVYLVWFRHRRMRWALWHFLPMAIVIAAYFAPLWLWYVDPKSMLKVVNEESIGRIAYFQMRHLSESPDFWLRAIMVVLPFGFWCFWEWRGVRDARMGSDDLALRMCSGGAVLAVVLLTCFPGRPTRYLLPNVMLFTFAVAPAVAHFFRHRGAVPGFARGVLWTFGFLGSAALIAIPFVPRAGDASVGLALAAAMMPLVVRRPSHVVLAALILPVVASWTVGLERSLRWSETKRSMVASGQLMRRELDQLGVTGDIGSYGHIDSSVLLATGLWVEGHELGSRIPDTRWVLQEESPRRPMSEKQYPQRWRLALPHKTFVLREQVNQAK